VGGPDVYLATGYKEWFEKRAVSIIHPDPAQCGGILESKKISDLATQHGIATAFHNHNNPTCCFAALHAAAASEQFMALDLHDCDHIDEFFSVVTGWPKPIISDGFMTVSDAPGMGYRRRPSQSCAPTHHQNAHALMSRRCQKDRGPRHSDNHKNEEK
jgi:L-alanine-DL-glutamate epimerase-like enolase superfamily enzyme